ncbi:MAG: MFS transporter [Oceanospirillaceae bacterium]|nr:MFS transporter [Oceanospirillaceae bacterium]
MTGITGLTQSAQRRAVLSLASLFVLRMLGLFMVLPVLMIDGQTLANATPELLGLAMGIYGLTQALLQIPAGALSDRIGRKPVIIIGLLIFAIGSFIAATADTITGLIIGRALQGGGAIASAIMALVTDLTDEEHRMKAMGTIGISIGVSFSVALVLGPWLASLGGLSTIFWLTGVLALAGIAVTMTLIPTPPTKRTHREASPVISEVWLQARNLKLWPLNIGVFLIHALMVAVFIAIPVQLLQLELPSDQHSWLYLPVLLVAFALMVPFIIIAEKKRKMKGVVLVGIGVLIVTLLLMSQANAIWHWATLLLLYFFAFNLMEASLPSWLSKIAPAGAKGSAMGIYSSMQFLGAFVGGVAGGWLMSSSGSDTLFLAFAIFTLLWGLWMVSAPAPRHLNSVRLSLGQALSDSQYRALNALDGVVEVIELIDERAIYMKISASEFDHSDALAIIENTGEHHGS